MRPTLVLRLFLALGHVLFLGLAVLALEHWRERTMQLDTACQLFKWINNEGLQIEAHRYSAILPQLVVKALASVGASLAALLRTASLAHVLVPWVIYALIAHGLRRPWIAIACAMSAVLCTRLSFYGPVLEAHYLVSYPFLLAAFIDRRVEVGRSMGSILGCVLSLAAVLLAHPMGAVVALFIIGLYWSRGLERRFLFSLAVIVVAWTIIGRMVFPPTGYEQGFYDAIGSGLHSFADGGSQPVFAFLMGHTWEFTSHYLPCWLLLIALIIMLARSRSWLILGFVLLSAGGFIAVNAAAYYHGETAMMLEKNFIPLALMVALPLALEMRTKPEASWRWSLLPFALILFFQFRHLSFASRESHARLALLDQVAEQARAQGVSKGLVETADLDDLGLHVHWALGYETLLISAVQGADHAVLVLPATDAERIIRDPGGSPLAGHRILPEELDPKWFRLAEGDFRVISLRAAQ